MSTVPDRAVIAVIVVTLFLALASIGASAVSDSSGGERIDDGASNTTATQPEVDTTVTRIAIEENGTARWSVTIRTRLANETDVDDYEAFQERFRSERDAHVQRFERRMSGVVSSASESTDREMNASGFRAETSIQEVPRRWGVVTYSFRWTNFAAVEADAVAVGDVFEGGLYLDADDRLEIVPPDGYAPATTSPPADETDGATVVWVGAEDFADRQPTVRFEPAESATASDTTDSGRGTATTVVGVTSVLVLVGITVAVVADRDRRRRLRSRIPIPLESSADPTDEAATETATESDEPDRSSAASEAAAGPGLDSDHDPDLVTDEGRVQRLLERNGGRMRQAAIAEELEWSASKTSRVVSGMADDETVEKLRVGRENVIDLRGESD